MIVRAHVPGFPCSKCNEAAIRRVGGGFAEHTGDGSAATSRPPCRYRRARAGTRVRTNEMSYAKTDSSTVVAYPLTSVVSICFPGDRCHSIRRSRRAGFRRLRRGARRPLRAERARTQVTASARCTALGDDEPLRSLVRDALRWLISWKNGYKSSEAAWLPEAASTRARRMETAASAGALRADEVEN